MEGRDYHRNCNRPGNPVVPNASIEAKNSQTEAVFRAASTGTGNYMIPELPVGRYSVSTTVAGFKSYTHENLAVPEAQTIRVNIAGGSGIRNTCAVTQTLAGRIVVRQQYRSYQLRARQLPGVEDRR